MTNVNERFYNHMYISLCVCVCVFCLKSRVYFKLTAHLSSGLPRVLDRAVLKASCNPQFSVKMGIHACVEHSLFPCFWESELFSQQLLGVSVMPSCAGCSVRILFASLLIIFSFITVFLVVSRVFLQWEFFQCEIS